MDQEQVYNSDKCGFIIDETLGATAFVDKKGQIVVLTGDHAMQVLSDVDYEITSVRMELEKRFPQLKIESISFLAEGLDNRAYRVNEDYIFRIPKTEEKSKFLKRELGLMPLVQQYSNVPVPTYEYVSSGTKEDNRCFAGCKAFQGKQLTAKDFSELPPDQKENYLSDIARFLKDLHSIPKEEALNCDGIYETDDKGMYQWYADDFFPKEILPKLAQEEAQKVALCLKDYLADQNNFKYRPVLLHGDMKFEHLFTDPNDHHVQGVIDFDSMVGDPDYDFMRLNAEMDKESFRQLLALYGHAAPDRCERKVRVFQICRYAQKYHDFIEAGKDDESVKEWEKMKAVIAELPWRLNLKPQMMSKML